MALLHEEDEGPDQLNIKVTARCGGQMIVVTQKSHTTSEFIVMAKYGVCTLLRLASSLVTMHSQCQRKFEF